MIRPPVTLQKLRSKSSTSTRMTHTCPAPKNVREGRITWTRRTRIIHTEPPEFKNLILTAYTWYLIHSALPNQFSHPFRTCGSLSNRRIRLTQFQIPRKMQQWP